LTETAEAIGVRFLGMRRDVEELYPLMDIFALPSHREGFPRAAMEAAAAGVPIVATNIRGCRQVVDNGVNGLLIPLHDPDALAEALRLLGEDTDRRLSMGKASRAKAEAEFDEDLVVSRVISCYDDLTQRKIRSWDASP
jgi:glycosyltransferase involved in cell wall biosynthesis